MFKRKKEPNRLMQSDIVKFSDDPLLGALVLQTANGTIDMAINRLGAAELRDELNLFLDGKSLTLAELELKNQPS